MGDFGGKRACGDFVTLSEHSNMAQNVSASLKAKTLRLQWMKLALSVIASPRYAARSKCNTRFRTTKYWKEVVSPLLIWTLPVHCRNCFWISLFKFVLVRSSLCILTSNFATESITLSPFIWHGFCLYFETCADPYRASLEIAFQNNVKRYNEGSVQTCCFSRTSNKENYLRVVVCIFHCYSDI